MHITILITCLLTLDTNDKKKKKKRGVGGGGGGGECIHIFYIIFHIVNFYSYCKFTFE
jgi:hypothetical protein